MISLKRTFRSTSFSIANANSDKPIAHVTAKVVGNIEESKKSVRIDELSKYEQDTEQIMKERITALLKKLQKAGVDPIGFGLKYRATHRTDDKDWEQWQKVKYPNLDFQVTTKVTLHGGTGAIE